jgi:hypothetical protein
MALAEKKRQEEEEEKAEQEALKLAEEAEAAALRNLPSQTSFYEEEKETVS